MPTLPKIFRHVIGNTLIIFICPYIEICVIMRSVIKGLPCIGLIHPNPIQVLNYWLFQGCAKESSKKGSQLPLDDLEGAVSSDFLDPPEPVLWVCLQCGHQVNCIQIQGIS